MGRHRNYNNFLTATCIRCGKEKSLEDFYMNNAHGNGKTNKCKDCCKKTVKTANYTLKNICIKCGKKTFRKKYCSRQCFLDRNITISPSGERMLRCSRCGVNKPLSSEFFTRRKENTNLVFSCHCKICCSKLQNQWRITPRGKQLRRESNQRNIETKKRYQEKWKPDRRNYEKTLRKTDPSFALKNRVRILMYAMLRKVKNGRRWQDLVEYSIDDLRRHIEKQFKDGMSWDRFLAGEIHIDHVIPVSAFNFKCPKDFDFKRCWALKNLQPMWATENLRKNNKLENPFQPSLLI